MIQSPANQPVSHLFTNSFSFASSASSSSIAAASFFVSNCVVVVVCHGSVKSCVFGRTSTFTNEHDRGEICVCDRRQHFQRLTPLNRSFALCAELVVVVEFGLTCDTEHLSGAKVRRENVYSRFLRNNILFL